MLLPIIELIYNNNVNYYNSRSSKNSMNIFKNKNSPSNKTKNQMQGLYNNYYNNNNIIIIKMIIIIVFKI